MSLKEDYNKIATSDRSDYETRAEDYAKMTIPSIFVEESHGKGSDYESNYGQSLGGRLIYGFCSKMALTLVPPSSSSFKLVPDAEATQVITEGNEEMNDEVANQFSQSSYDINNEIEAQDIRLGALQFLMHLTVVGSCVIEKLPKDGIKVHTLKNFVVKLNKKFDATMIILKETLTKQGLPADIAPSEEKEEYELYTMITLSEESTKEKKQWVVTQELEGQPVGKEQKHDDDSVPFQYLGWFASDGDKFHRPMVEMYYDDLVAYNDLNDVLTKGAIISSKNITFVDEKRGRTRKSTVEKAANGDIVDGSADDVTSFQHGKQYDYQVAENRMAALKSDLEADFLSNKSISRDAERVTAREIQMMANELETTQTGMYSMLSKKFSKRNVIWIMKELKIKFEAVDVKVIAGLDALGKSFEAQKFDEYISRMTNLQMLHVLKPKEISRRYAEYYGINTNNLVKSQAEIDAEKQAQEEAMAKEKMMDAGAANMTKQ